MVTVQYEEEGRPATFRDADSCLSFLQDLHLRVRRPVGVQLSTKNGDSLFLVLGGAASYAEYFPEGWVRTSASSTCASADVVVSDPIDYWFCGEHGQVALRHALSINACYEIARHFVSGRGRWPGVNWELP